MNYLIRSARISDVKQLLELSQQFTLLNLPSDRKTITQKVEKSLASFERQLGPEDSDYLFVMEDLESRLLVGSSQLLGKKGTPEHPAYSFEIQKREKFSRDLGVGFIHQILRLKVQTNGSCEVGGLVIDRGHRRLPEKLGRQMSLIRFLFLKMQRERFGETVHAEMAPPLTDEGRSEFWESLGRRFTGMPYWEADALSRSNKLFIQDLFPSEDLFMALLDSKARLVVGRVGEETQAAEHLLKKLGFETTNEVDPFDGGPHLRAIIDQIPFVKNTKEVRVLAGSSEQFETEGFLAFQDEDGFTGGFSLGHVEGDEVRLPEMTLEKMSIETGQKIYFCENL